MIFKNIFIFLIIFSLQNKVQPNTEKNLLEITDIKSIKNFLREKFKISNTDFESFNNLTLEEKNATAGEIIGKSGSFIEKIIAMRSKDERSDDFLWSQFALGKFKPLNSLNFVKLIDTSSRIKTVCKHVRFSRRKITNRYIDFMSNNEQDDYCMLAWGMHELALYNEFDFEIGYEYSDVVLIDNVRQLLLDIVCYLSEGEIKGKNRYDFCDRGSSFHLGLFELYKNVLIISLEEFSVEYFAMMGQAVCQPGIYHYQYKLSRWEENFIRSWKKIMDTTVRAMNATKYYVYNCHHINREKELILRYTSKAVDDLDLQLGGMMQTIIISEPDMTTTKSCNHNCNLDSIKNTLSNKECDEFLDCQYLSSAYEIYELANSSRRYSHFTGDDRTEYGNKNRYLGEQLQKSQVSRTYNAAGINWCDYCICTCVKKRPSSSPHSITALSFRPQLSDIENNMAVVRLMFIKQDHMIHIQIREGQILPYGRIGNESWKPLEKFEYNDRTQKFYIVNNNESKVPAEEGIHYGHPRGLNLNDIIAPEKYIVTGVRFQFAGDSVDSPKLKKGPIELKIRVTPLDFVKGQLININQSMWISPKEKVLKDELVLENLDNPAYPPDNVEPIITSNKFVKFRVSDLKKDAGQSTVPFFDDRQLAFYKSCPLSGIGLIHRGHPGFGGHIDWKLFDFDMSPYFNSIDE